MPLANRAGESGLAASDGDRIFKGATSAKLGWDFSCHAPYGTGVRRPQSIFFSVGYRFFYCNRKRHSSICVPGHRMVRCCWGAPSGIGPAGGEAETDTLPRRSDGTESGMTKHTPGPWRVEIDPMSKTEARTLVMPADAEMYGKWIALTWPEDDDQDDFENYCTLSEAEANARLIAAAPALVEALRALVEDMTEMAQANYREWPDPEGPPVFNDQIWLEADAAEFALVQQARAALKLAGEP